MSFLISWIALPLKFGAAKAARYDGRAANGKLQRQAVFGTGRFSQQSECIKLVHLVYFRPRKNKPLSELSHAAAILGPLSTRSQQRFSNALPVKSVLNSAGVRCEVHNGGLSLASRSTAISDSS